MDSPSPSPSADRSPFSSSLPRWSRWSTVLWTGSMAVTAWANPQGLTVSSGTASTTSQGSQLTITVGNQAVLDWHSFNIAPGELTQFLQPSAQSVVLNRIHDQNPSQIWGQLTANGTVILANGHGFYFGPNSLIAVGGSFIATTAANPIDLGNGGGWTFTGLPPTADIVNYGTVQTGRGGSLFLIAERIENHGTLLASGGDIWLSAGKSVLLSDRPDGRGLSAKVTVPAGAIDNSGRLIADAGTLSLQAEVINQNGLVQANSVRERQGVIELVAGQDLQLGPQSQLQARGDTDGPSPGGIITLKSAGSLQDQPGSVIDLRPGDAGGHGGQLELSAPRMASIQSELRARTAAGYAGSKLLLDPQDIILGKSGEGTVDPSGQVDASAGSGVLRLNVDTAFLGGGFSDLILQATRNITLAQGTRWDLSTSTGLTEGAHRLTLQAGADIIFENNTSLIDSRQWSVRLEAGYDFTRQAVVPGRGSLLFNGGVGKTLNGSVELAAGSFTGITGKDILVGTGYLRTNAGGDIALHALSGDIDAGRKNDSYDFLTTGYRIGLNGPGGITTLQGGDVTLDAGRDIISNPTTPSTQTPGGSGALGAEPGNVTLHAGRLITGNYFLRNGVGTILAGLTLTDGKPGLITNPQADIGSSTRPVSLSLVDGTWNVWAAHDVFLSEIRNPNGTFNRNRQTVPTGAYQGNLDAEGIPVPVPERTAFLFDYAADAGAKLWAGNGITLLGANLPRITGQNQNSKAVYPPQLSLTAGAGGIEVDNSLVLFPSTQGSLSIQTTDGGSLRGQQQQSSLTGITLSDSGLPTYASFFEGHAQTPLHAGTGTPVKVDVAGSIENFSLNIPQAAEITVGQDTYNFGFRGQNTGLSDVTRISVGRDIRYRGNLTETAWDGSLPLEFANPELAANLPLALRVAYNPVTKSLSFRGQMTVTELDYLLNPQVLVFDPANGAPILDEQTGLQRTTPLAIPDGLKSAFQKLYTDSQSASLGDQGLALSGPGRFVIEARNADLGISGGIAVQNANPALAAISLRGADLAVQLRGNLEMSATRISNEGLLGSVRVEAAGTVTVGSANSGTDTSGIPKGIFTTSSGNVSVQAGGDVNVAGSRIAVYNGGNLSVKSVNGDVNAGSGGSGYVTVNTVEADPATGSWRRLFGIIPGNGLLATTLPGGDAALGNISVDAPNGSIVASLGGVIQLAFNDRANPDSTIALNAGKNIDAGGSGIIGSNIKLTAGGNITGVIIGSEGIDISSRSSVQVTAFSPGGVSISAAGTVSGTVVGGGAVAVSGDSISAALVSSSVSTSGDASGAAVGVSTAGAPRNDSKVTDDAAAGTARSAESSLDDDEARKKRLAAAPKLTRGVGRVTVLLPPKSTN